MITSPANPLIKQIKRLRQRKHRQREGLYLVEGLRPVLTAIEQQAPIERLIYCDELLRSNTGQEAVAAWRQTGRLLTPVPAPLFRTFAARDNPVGLLALVQQQWTPLQSLVPPPGATYVALEGAGDPGNVGTILRTLDSVGASGLLLLGQGTDPFHPTAVKASLGALFTVPICTVSTVAELQNWASAHDLPLIATSARAAPALWDVTMPESLLFLMGSERTGLTEELMRLANQQVRIPMRGHASSLNLAAAAAVLLYERLRQQLQ